MTTITELDGGRVEEFAGRMVGLLNDSMLSLMTSVGHRTGLFDTMATLPPATSTAIAEAAGLNERYVREWLNAMTVGRVVDYDASKGTYVLPAEHAASLTRAAGPGNLANMAQFIALMGGVEDEIVDCFRAGGGVPYSHFPKFQQLMAEMSGEVHDVALIEGELALVDGLIDRMRDGIDVCDIGCGQGHAINLMARAFPNSRFTGLDFSEDAIASATARGGGARVDQRHLRGQGRRDPRRLEPLRPDDRVRRDPRPGETRRRAAGDRRLAAAPTVCSSAWTSPARAMSRTTSTTRWPRCSTRCRPSTA